MSVVDVYAFIMPYTLRAARAAPTPRADESTTQNATRAYQVKLRSNDLTNDLTLIITIPPRFRAVRRYRTFTLALPYAP